MEVLEGIPNMMTIREVARTGILTESVLRRMDKQGKLPCIKVGNRCLINFDALVKQLQSLQGA